MIGDEILVAPVLQETIKNDVEVRKVYLPKGIWLDPFDNVVNISAGKIYNASAALGQVPYFRKQK